MRARCTGTASTLVETGVHADYVEHWVRDDGPASPRWAWAAAADGGACCCAVGAVSAGRADAVSACHVGDREGKVLAISRPMEMSGANGMRWNVVQIEGDVEL